MTNVSFLFMFVFLSISVQAQEIQFTSVQIFLEGGATDFGTKYDKRGTIAINVEKKKITITEADGDVVVYKINSQVNDGDKTTYLCENPDPRTGIVYHYELIHDSFYLTFTVKSSDPKQGWSFVYGLVE